MKNNRNVKCLDIEPKPGKVISLPKVNSKGVKGLKALLDTPVDVHEKKKNYLSEAEVQQLVFASGQKRSPLRNRLLITMMYKHGLRVSEAINIKLDDIDFDNARLWVNRLKDGLSTEHPIDRKYVFKNIKKHIGERKDLRSPYLFQNESGDPLTRQGVNYIIKQASKRCNLTNVHPHMLRHSCGYYLANKGYNLRLIQDYLGHRNPMHTAKYTRTNANRFLGIMD